MQQKQKDEEIATDTSAMISRYRNMMSKVNSRNIVATMANYSIDFYNEGYDYYDAACEYAMAFVTPGYALKLSNFRPTYAAVQLPYGYIEGVLHVKETENGYVVNEGDYMIGMYLVKVGSYWYLYGDQTASAETSRSIGEKVKNAYASPVRGG
jgi:hypothetical protein